MNYESLIKMDMHMLKMYYKMLVDEVKEENKQVEESQKTNNSMSMPQMPSMPSMPTFNMPNFNFSH